jgi:hypothetical protein
MAVPTPSPHMHIPRGDAAVRKKKMDYVPNVVKTMHIGNTTLEFCDNFIPRDPAARQRNIDEFIRIHKMLQIKNARRAAELDNGGGNHG